MNEIINGVGVQTFLNQPETVAGLVLQHLSEGQRIRAAAARVGIQGLSCLEERYLDLALSHELAASRLQREASLDAVSIPLRLATGPQEPTVEAGRGSLI